MIFELLGAKVYRRWGGDEGRKGGEARSCLGLMTFRFAMFVFLRIGFRAIVFMCLGEKGIRGVVFKGRSWFFLLGRNSMFNFWEDSVLIVRILIVTRETIDKRLILRTMWGTMRASGCHSGSHMKLLGCISGSYWVLFWHALDKRKSGHIGTGLETNWKPWRRALEIH